MEIKTLKNEKVKGEFSFRDRSPKTRARAIRKPYFSNSIILFVLIRYNFSLDLLKLQ